MAITNPYQVYKNQSVMLATPEELTLMLYNGCAKFISQAIISISNNDFAKANESIQRSQDIIEEFMLTINMSYEVSHGLMALYQYMNSRLIDANIAKDNIILQEVLDMVIELRDTWEKAMGISTSSINKKGRIKL